MTKLKVWELSLLIAISISLCAGTWAQARQNDISGSLIRLHVLAASDDAAEQELKLRVRDAVLEYVSPLLEGAESAEEARALLSASLDKIAAAARAASEGRTVTVRLGEELYPTRDYGSFALPAGRYDSLRVILGEGKGHNWWCVVFPPLCVDAAEQELALDTLSEDVKGIVADAEGYTIRFRIVELWNELANSLRKK